MSTPLHFDLLIVGGGQAGIPLAHAMAKVGRSVALAERKQLGGSCVNFGCTPTKAALASALLAHQARRASEFGLRIPEVDVDFGAVIARARAIAAESRHSLEKRLEKSENPRWLRGHARFTGRSGRGFHLSIDTIGVTASQVVLDTGTRTTVPPIPGIEGVDFLHAGNWLERSDRPAHLAMIGGGVIALEMGQFYARMGTRVTLLVRSDRIAAREDPDVAETLHTALAAEGLDIRTATAVDGIEKSGSRLRLATRRSLAESGRGGIAPLGPNVARVPAAESTETVEVTHVFVAAGRTPNTDDLGLETVGLERARDGMIPVNDRLATPVQGIWAAGDIRGGPMFTHTSWDDHRILHSQLAGDRSRTTRRIVPYAIFTDPELGRVGMCESEARASGKPFEVKRFDMASNGRARESGESTGFIKVMIEKGSNQILGAVILGASAGELVHLYVDLMNAGAPSTVIRDAIHIHPTLAEAVQSAVS